MDWADLLPTVDRWAAACAKAAAAVRPLAAAVPAAYPVGYYWGVDTGQVGLYAPAARPADLARCKAAAEAADAGPVRRPTLATAELAAGRWVKVAYSPTLRRVGEALNFFPGQYPGGLPNHASPLAAMLTSGLVGAGLGYGAGWLAETALPDRWERGRLRRTLAALGAAGGAALGSGPALLNAAGGRPLNDTALLAGPPALTALGPQGKPPNPDAGLYVTPYVGVRPPPRAKRGGDAFGEAAGPRDATPLDVSIDALGRTLWEGQASPQVTAAALGTAYAAGQVYDPSARPGHVTAHQFGRLALAAGQGYLTGRAVGSALSLAVGMPAQGWGSAGAAAALIGAAVPRLFGR